MEILYFNRFVFLELIRDNIKHALNFSTRIVAFSTNKDKKKEILISHDSFRSHIIYIKEKDTKKRKELVKVLTVLLGGRKYNAAP